MTDKQTEQKILDAARNLFTRKGMSGTKMQEIADEAGINKALLHYYFRSKEKLFDRIFQEVFVQLFPKMQILIINEKPLEDKVREFVDEYISVLQANPFLPLFILHEIQRDPENLQKKFESTGFEPQFIVGGLAQSLNMTKQNVLSLIINLLSLCIFPFAARPLLSRIIFDNDQESYEAFLEDRKKTIPTFIINAIKNQ